VLVREPTELERLAAAESPELGAALLGGTAALAAERLDERPVLREQVVPGERRRLIGGAEERARRHGSRVSVAGRSLRRPVNDHDRAETSDDDFPVFVARKT
jgi:hypothetical protein